jgi:uncharacterized protein YqgV (UPF0045/DUF77 family)
MHSIDQAIALIKSYSALAVEVGAFGTSVEGPKAEVIDLVTALMDLNEAEFLINVQFHIGTHRLSNQEKVAKHRY